MMFPLTVNLLLVDVILIGALKPSFGITCTRIGSVLPAGNVIVDGVMRSAKLGEVSRTCMR